ncbi:CRISPR-associated helicase Cas3' [[Phormidium ambiguum] IAM M-71]|uniref:CRISPR-associated helicase Cas3 n=1 Tax=[Phormidium ambiguum] IAM M-71 TaxID=454136 RepID=A0A1U7IFF4_9CYAN|nr:CRISPR-associated helicase Cas3' [Phormidium ambiguum]OKH35679.1 CRISPR-associated helicase Cas3' [Phormidium ambiguum IAM M-71]
MEIIEVSQTDLVEIEGDRHRTFRAINTPLTADVILDDIQQNQRQRVIVICNTVSQAQGLLRDLDALNCEGKLKITLLHSRFLPEHRAQKEADIKTLFSEQWQADSYCHILIATQVIEAGLNITCEIMHAELCPMNSLLQRAGRCARFKGEKGEVCVYWSIQINPENGELGERDFAEEPTEQKKSFLPYERELCELTWQVLEAHTQSEQVDRQVDFNLEQAWINQVHIAADSLQAERRKNSSAEFERKFNDAIFTGDRSVADDLIRHVDNRSVFVWNEPTLIDFDDNQQINPKKLLAFSVPLTTLLKVWREVQNLEYQIDWIFKRIEAPKGKAAETYNQPVCITVRSHTDLVNSWQILVNPRYVYYDEEIGLLIGINVEGNHFTSPNKLPKQAVSEYEYQMDTYVGHLGCMWKCWRESFSTIGLKNGNWVKTQYGSVRHELLNTGGRFIQQKILTQLTIIQAEELFEYLVLLAIFTHDLGKLQIKWQAVMKGWQAIAHSSFKGKPPKSHLLAHTDYNPEDEEQKQALKAYEAKHKRPNHAVESAFLAQYILQQSLFPLLQNEFNADNQQIFGIIYTVILAAGRHHSAWAKGWEIKEIRKIGDIQLHPEAQNAIASSWRSLTRWLSETLLLPPEVPNLNQNCYPIRELDLKRFSLNQMEYLQLYWLVVRALRLCDQRSVQL